MRSLAAFCARIQPRNTAELASLVLYMGEKSTGASGCSMPRSGPWAPCPASGSPVTRQHPGRRPGPGSRNRSASLPPYDTLAQRKRPRHGRAAGSRAEPGDVADASGDPDGHGLELIPDHLSWPRQVTAEQQLTEEPGAQGDY